MIGNPAQFTAPYSPTWPIPSTTQSIFIPAIDCSSGCEHTQQHHLVTTPSRQLVSIFSRVLVFQTNHQQPTLSREHPTQQESHSHPTARMLRESSSSGAMSHCSTPLSLCSFNVLVWPLWVFVCETTYLASLFHIAEATEKWKVCPNPPAWDEFYFITWNLHNSESLFLEHPLVGEGVVVEPDIYLLLRGSYEPSTTKLEGSEWGSKRLNERR